MQKSLERETTEWLLTARDVLTWHIRMQEYNLQPILDELARRGDGA